MPHQDDVAALAKGRPGRCLVGMGGTAANRITGEQKSGEAVDMWAIYLNDGLSLSQVERPHPRSSQPCSGAVAPLFERWPMAKASSGDFTR